MVKTAGSIPVRHSTMLYPRGSGAWLQPRSRGFDPRQHLEGPKRNLCCASTHPALVLTTPPKHEWSCPALYAGGARSIRAGGSTVR